VHAAGVTGTWTCSGAETQGLLGSGALCVKRGLHLRHSQILQRRQPVKHARNPSGKHIISQVPWGAPAEAKRGWGHNC
jgi:hypothetical protein